MRQHLDPYPSALARFRPTRCQAASRGAARGAGIGTLAAVVLAALVAVAGSGARRDLWPAVLVPLLGGALLGAVAGLFAGRSTGVDADDLGLHRVPPVPAALWPPPFAPWQRISDIRAERRGSRTVVAIYLDFGPVSRLPAPYDGRWLERDAQFEWKLFTLRNLWETHRTGSLP